MKNFNIFGLPWKIRFSTREGSRKTTVKGGLSKKGVWKVFWFKEWGAWQEIGGVDTPIHTISSQNNLKITTNCYKKKCLLVITKNKKHSSNQVVPIRYWRKDSLLLQLFKVCGWFFSEKVKKCVANFALFEACFSRGQ